MPRTALLLGAALVGTVATFSTWTGGAGLGIAPAEAAAPYARKKAAGRWTGKSARVSVKRGAWRGKSVRYGRVAQPRPRPAGAMAPNEPRPEPVSSAGAAEAPAPAPAVAADPGPLSAPASPETTTGSIALAPERVAPRSSDLPPPDRVIATASIGLLHPTPGLEKMRSGLEERARAIRAASDPLALPLPDRAPPIRMVAKSVTFDLARGERTIVFEDGETITAPFDRSTAADLTGFQAASR